MGVVEIGLLPLSAALVVGGGGVALGAARPYGRELDEGVEAGVLTPEQADALRSRRAVALARERRERAAKALGILGAAALGVGVILFFAANWDEISKPLRVAILAAGLVAFYSAGFWLLEARRAYRNVAHGFVFVGAILFGASLFLVGQMYNVETHDPLGFLIWAGGALATALFFRSKPAAGLFVLAFEAWIVHEVVEQDTEFDSLVFIPYVLALYGLALYAVGTAGARWLDRFRLTGALRVVGFGLAALMTFVLSFRYPHLTEGERPEGLPLAIVLVTAAVALAGAAVLAVTATPASRRVEALVLAAATALVLLATFLPEDPEGDRFAFEAKVYPLLFAALLVIVAAGAIVVGSLRDEMWLTSAGVSVAALAIIGHFLDVAWDRLPRSAVFAAVGALALATAAALERASRRKALL